MSIDQPQVYRDYYNATGEADEMDTSGFRALAARAWQEFEANEKARDEEDQAIQTARTLRVFGQDFGLDALNVTAEGRVILTHDGVRLRLLESEYDSRAWQVWGACPLCGDLVWSEESWNMDAAAYVGKMLEKFAPRFDHVAHDCKGRKSSPQTAAERLAELIRQIAIEGGAE